MTKQRLPDICNFCAKEINSETQYISEWFQGKSTFSDPRIRLKEKLDCCHNCFLEMLKVCKLKPTWVKEMKNPQYVKGSTIPEQKAYWLEQNLEETPPPA